MVSDVFFGRIAPHTGRATERLWIEDSFGRLTRNGFTAGSYYQATVRPGVGLVLTPSPQGNKITPRRGGSLISYEMRNLAEIVRATDVRVRVCVKSIVVMPSLRLFSIHVPSLETWEIRGATLRTQDGERPIDTSSPIAFRSAPAVLTVQIDATNVVFATEVIGNVKPGEVRVSGEEIMVCVAHQYLSAAGYSQADPGVWRR